MHWCAVPWVSWAIEMAVAVPFAAKGLLSVVDPRVVRWASDLGPKSDSLRDSLVCPTFMCQQKYTILEHCWDIGSLLSSAIYSFIISFGQRSVTRSPLGSSQGSTVRLTTLPCRLSVLRSAFPSVQRCWTRTPRVGPGAERRNIEEDRRIRVGQLAVSSSTRDQEVRTEFGKLEGFIFQNFCMLKFVLTSLRG